ncbi:sigma-70 family RNA polymerase sigma factor [Sorangium sp. So ce448]|uniref:RNA polymerase sigma factor n=1 Tax=Sorangium sp. So ce448 TaxID=3133314 RepID=UPI003F6395CD
MPLADFLSRAAMLSAPPDVTDLAPIRARLFGRLRASGWAPSGDLRGRPPSLADSDEALLAAFVRGDAAAFDALFDRHAELLNGCARRQLRLQPADAADAVQEAFLVLFRKAETVLAHESVNVRGFLFVTLRNKAVHLLAARSREAAAGPTGDDEPSLDEGGLTELLRREAAERLALLLERACNPLEQEVVCMDIDGHSGPEIAGALGITPDHVRVLRHRALRKLRDALAEEGPS